MADCGAGVQANVHYMLLRVFDTFDADGDGFLSKDEIYAMKEATGRRSFGAEHPHASLRNEESRQVDSGTTTLP